jgi:hypothetical protein
MLDSAICSPEIDILVSDPSRHVALFNEGSLQVVVPTSVLATIEVKSTYSPTVLRDSLNSNALTRSCCFAEGRVSEIWSAIFITAAKDKFDISALHQLLETFAGGNIPSRQTESAIDNRRLLPHCIAIQDGGLSMIEAVDDDRIKIRTFECPTIALSLALAQCFSHIQSVTRISQYPGELEDLLRNVDFSGRQINTTVRVQRS